ncbi:MAG: thioredoxin [Pedobacter sp.]|nr:MAG: thioredoxin [Pedobacter sp.]
MNRILTIFILLIAMNASAQKINKQIEDKTRNKTVLINNCTREGLITFPEFKERYDTEYPNYKPDSLTLDSVKPLVAGKKITIVLGTWCGDSKFQVPHFFKIVDQLGIPEKDITIISVDGTKKAENGLLDNLKIERVPTMIFYEKDKELGRIIESPIESLEKDMHKILAKK